MYNVYTLETASNSPGAKKTKIPDSSDDGMYLVIYTSGLKPGEHH